MCGEFVCQHLFDPSRVVVRVVPKLMAQFGQVIRTQPFDGFPYSLFRYQNTFFTATTSRALKIESM